MQHKSRGANKAYLFVKQQRWLKQAAVQVGVHS